MRFIRKRWFPIVTGLLLLILFGSIGYWLHWGATRLDVMGHPPDFTMQNEQSQNVKFSSTDGKIRVVEFFYASCATVCPVTTAQLVKVQNEMKKEGHFGKDVDFVSITFDPTRDTPKVLQMYAHNMGIDQSGWTILHGTEQETKTATDDYGVYVEKQPDGTFVHSTEFFLLDDNGNIRGKYAMGDETETNHVINDIHNLLNDKKFPFSL